MTIEELQGRSVLVTGGANGIGAAIVRAFGRQGARVFFCDRDARAGRKLAAELGSWASFQPLDLMQEKAILRWVAAVRGQVKRIDVLVNNAALDPRIDLSRTTSRMWDELFAVNVR